MYQRFSCVMLLVLCWITSPAHATYNWYKYSGVHPTEQCANTAHVTIKWNAIPALGTNGCAGATNCHADIIMVFADRDWTTNPTGGTGHYVEAGVGYLAGFGPTTKQSGVYSSSGQWGYPRKLGSVPLGIPVTLTFTKPASTQKVLLTMEWDQGTYPHVKHHKLKKTIKVTAVSGGAAAWTNDLAEWPTTLEVSNGWSDVTPAPVDVNVTNLSECPNDSVAGWAEASPYVLLNKTAFSAFDVYYNP